MVAKTSGCQCYRCGKIEKEGAWRDNYWYCKKCDPWGDWGRKGNFISIDPGETVGWAMFQWDSANDKIELVDQGQAIWQEFLEDFETLLMTKRWKGKVLIEDYIIRRDTIGANIGSKLITVKVIGVLEWLIKKAGLEYDFEPAGIGNHFFSRQRLTEMGMWIVGAKHSRSAIRLALYCVTFGRGKKKVEQ